MGMFEMSDEQVASGREKCRELVAAARRRRRGRRGGGLPAGRRGRELSSPRRRSSAALVYAGIKMLTRRKPAACPTR